MYLEPLQLMFGLMLTGEAAVLTFLVWTRRVRMSLKMDYGLSFLALGLALAGISTLESNVCEPIGRLWRLGLIGGGGLLFSIAMLVWAAKPEQQVLMSERVPLDTPLDRMFPKD